MPKIKVLLADDHLIVRDGLRAILQTESDITVVGEAETGWQAVHLARKLSPDVVVLDIAMPTLDGLEGARQIAKQVPTARVLVLSSYSHDEYVRRATEAGAAGYLIKQTAAAELIKAVRELKRGNTYFSAAVARRMIEPGRGATSRGAPARTRVELLTSREAEVLRLIAEGKPNKQIASELCISARTVEKHRQSLMNKLDMHDVASLTRYAISKGTAEFGSSARM